MVAAPEALFGFELAWILDPMETLATISSAVVTEKMILRILYLRLTQPAIRGERSELNKVVPETKLNARGDAVAAV
jgi:hypothetical protein